MANLIDWLQLAATFLAPPVLNAIAWWCWSKTTPVTRSRGVLTVSGLVLNSTAVAVTSFVIAVPLIAAALNRGTPLEGWTFQEIDFVALFVVGASVLSGICGLFATSWCRIILVATSLLAGAFWAVILPHIGFL
jgi:hypothetical protein